MKRLSGVLLVLASAVAFGAMAVLAPTAYRAGTNPISLLFLRFALAVLLLHEKIGWVRLVGGFCILVAVVYLARAEMRAGGGREPG
jgi:hypothetical protein